LAVIVVDDDVSSEDDYCQQRWLAVVVVMDVSIKKRAVKRVEQSVPVNVTMRHQANAISIALVSCRVD
jgi:hypothetical protein